MSCLGPENGDKQVVSGQAVQMWVWGKLKLEGHQASWGSGAESHWTLGACYDQKCVCVLENTDGLHFTSCLCPSPPTWRIRIGASSLGLLVPGSWLKSQGFSMLPWVLRHGNTSIRISGGEEKVWLMVYMHVHWHSQLMQVLICSAHMFICVPYMLPPPHPCTPCFCNITRNHNQVSEAGTEISGNRTLLTCKPNPSSYMIKYLPLFSWWLYVGLLFKEKLSKAHLVIIYLMKWFWDSSQEKKYFYPVLFQIQLCSSSSQNCEQAMFNRVEPC